MKIGQEIKQASSKYSKSNLLLWYGEYVENEDFPTAKGFLNYILEKAARPKLTN